MKRASFHLRRPPLWIGAVALAASAAADEGQATLSSRGYPVVAAAQRGAVDGNASSSHLTGDARVEWAVSPRLSVSTRVGVFGEEQNGGTSLTRSGVRLLRAASAGRWQGWDGRSLSFSAYGDLERFRQVRARLGPGRDSEAEAGRQRVPGGQVGGLLSFSPRPLGRHRPSLGMDLRYARGQTDETLSPASVRPDSVLARSAGGAQAFLAALAEDSWLPHPKLEGVAGLRLDGWRNGRGFAERTLPDGTTETDRFTPRWESQLSPRLGIRWTASEALTLRASAARAFRAPTLNELYRPFQVGTILTAANAGLRAERAWTAELGAEARLGAGRSSPG